MKLTLIRKKIRKEKTKNHYNGSKGKLQKILREYYRNLSEEDKIEKRYYANIGNKNMPGPCKGRNKIYEKLLI